MRQGHRRCPGATPSNLEKQSLTLEFGHCDCVSAVVLRQDGLTADSRRDRDPWSRSVLWTCCTATNPDEINVHVAGTAASLLVADTPAAFDWPSQSFSAHPCVALHPVGIRVAPSTTALSRPLSRDNSSIAARQRAPFAPSLASFDLVHLCLPWRSRSR
jgi:hypothetical protein